MKTALSRTLSEVPAALFSLAEPDEAVPPEACELPLRALLTPVGNGTGCTDAAGEAPAADLRPQPVKQTGSASTAHKTAVNSLKGFFMLSPQKNQAVAFIALYVSTLLRRTYKLIYGVYIYIILHILY
jgi:hypothetical protein